MKTNLKNTLLVLSMPFIAIGFILTFFYASFLIASNFMLKAIKAEFQNNKANQ